MKYRQRIIDAPGNRPERRRNRLVRAARLCMRVAGAVRIIIGSPRPWLPGK